MNTIDQKIEKKITEILNNVVFNLVEKLQTNNIIQSINSIQNGLFKVEDITTKYSKHGNIYFGEIYHKDKYDNTKILQIQDSYKNGKHKLTLMCFDGNIVHLFNKTKNFKDIYRDMDEIVDFLFYKYFWNLPTYYKKILK